MLVPAQRLRRPGPRAVCEDLLEAAVFEATLARSVCNMQPVLKGRAEETSSTVHLPVSCVQGCLFAALSFKLHNGIAPFAELLIQPVSLIIESTIGSLHSAYVIRSTACIHSNY